jgi:hypothetical protein
MVHTRSGQAVVHVETSYGRAARKESQRRRQKRRKLDSSRSESGPAGDGLLDGNAITTTPQRTMTRTRAQAQAQEEEELATPPGAFNQVAKTPPPKSERLLRQTRLPRCSDFGLARHFIFHNQGFNFCSPCDLWDACLSDCSKKMSRESARYACTAGHKFFSHPTSKRIAHYRMPRIMERDLSGEEDESHGLSADSCSSHSVVDDGDDDSNKNNTDDHFATAAVQEGTMIEINNNHDANNQPLSLSAATTTTRRTTRTTTIFCPPVLPTMVLHQTTPEVICQEPSSEELILELKGKIRILCNWNRKLTREIKKLREDIEKTKANASQQNAAYEDELLDAINGVTERHNRHWNSNRTGAQVAKALWTHVAFQPHLVKLARKHFRETLFTPFNILREMDLAGGTLSYEGIDVLRRVETCGIKRFHNSIEVRDQASGCNC